MSVQNGMCDTVCAYVHRHSVMTTTTTTMMMTMM